MERQTECFLVSNLYRRKEVIKKKIVKGGTTRIQKPFPIEM